MSTSIAEFTLPRFKEIPAIGLYLEQTVKYINECLAPLHCIEVTSSMVSNYVKKDYISRPVKKQYSSEQVAHLLFIAVAKQILPMDDVAKMIQIQQDAYSIQEAYDYFCDELEQAMHIPFESANDLPELAPDTTIEKKLLRSIVIAVSHVIYLSTSLEDPCD